MDARSFLDFYKMLSFGRFLLLKMMQCKNKNVDFFNLQLHKQSSFLRLLLIYVKKVKKVEHGEFICVAIAINRFSIVAPKFENISKK